MQRYTRRCRWRGVYADAFVVGRHGGRTHCLTGGTMAGWVTEASGGATARDDRQEFDAMAELGSRTTMAKPAPSAL